MRVLRRGSTITFMFLVTGAVLAAYFAPFVYPESEYRLHGPEAAVVPKSTVPIAGRWIDDYFVVEEIDPTTISIGEPRYYQGNYS